LKGVQIGGALTSLRLFLPVTKLANSKHSMVMEMVDWLEHTLWASRLDCCRRPG
jgi:hypothetical protein